MNDFLLMCEKADEIQKAWNPGPFQDFVAKKENKRVCTLGINSQSHYTFGNVPVDLDSVFWVPTIEQILNLRGLGKQPVVAISLSLANFVANNRPRYADETSMRVIALAYVMYILHNMEWNGQCWEISTCRQS